MALSLRYIHNSERVENGSCEGLRLVALSLEESTTVALQFTDIIFLILPNDLPLAGIRRS